MCIAISSIPNEGKIIFQSVNENYYQSTNVKNVWNVNANVHKNFNSHQHPLNQTPNTFDTFEVKTNWAEAQKYIIFQDFSLSSLSLAWLERHLKKMGLISETVWWPL